MCTVKIEVPALCARMLGTGYRLEWLPEYFVQHLTDSLLLFVLLFLNTIAVVDQNWQEREH
jgi:hypothetical protein